MTDCTCPIAGYCARHRVDKTEHWHKLCQTRDDYRAAWDAGRGPGQSRKPLTPEKMARLERSKAAAAADRRFIGWLKLFRRQHDRGLGDTVFRLVQASPRRTDAHPALEYMLKQCSCSRVDAVARLNREWPYSIP